MASHYIKNHMEHEDRDKHDECTLHGTSHAATCACTCSDVQSKEDLQTRGNSTCMDSCQRNTVSITQCVHVHKSVRV